MGLVLTKNLISSKLTSRHNHKQAQPQPCTNKNIYLTNAEACCIHVQLPDNLDRGFWMDLIIAYKITLLKAGINYRDS